MRGDQKWPPQSVKEAVAAENEARRQLAKGPACRPRKVRRDYINTHCLIHTLVRKLPYLNYVFKFSHCINYANRYLI